MKYLIVFGLMFCGLFGFAQPMQNHFVYLQTENKQPFYVKINKDILSSTSSGYLIIPKLVDSTYQFIIGFPANEWPEQNIILPVKKDAGFLLKNFSEKGWGLFDLQTFAVVMNGNKVSAEPEKVITSSDQFSTMLSQVVNDSSILKTTVPKKITVPQNQSKKDSSLVVTILPAKVNDTSLSKNVNDSAIQKITTSQNRIKNDSPIIETVLPTTIKDSSVAIKKISIEKLTSKTDSSGMEITFVDPAEKDTIKTIFDLMIDNSKIELPNQADTIKRNDVTLSNELAKKSNDVKNDSSKQVQFLDVKETSIVNSNCKQNAVEADVQKLQRKMLTETSDDGKLKVAKKTFKIKCFTTEYVRQLSRLFLTSAGKYAFFDMAYPYVSDGGLYNTLSRELLDNYYIKRFDALINK